MDKTYNDIRNAYERQMLNEGLIWDAVKGIYRYIKNRKRKNTSVAVGDKDTMKAPTKANKDGVTSKVDTTPNPRKLVKAMKDFCTFETVEGNPISYKRSVLDAGGSGMVFEKDCDRIKDWRLMKFKDKAVALAAIKGKKDITVYPIAKKVNPELLIVCRELLLSNM